MAVPMEKRMKNVKKRDCPNDVFITPDSLIEVHFNLIKPYLKEDDIILDPCSHHTQKYYNKFKDCGYETDWCEITMGRDFLLHDRVCNVICGNPPYSIINPFLDKIIELRPRVCSLLIGFMNLTTKRLEVMEKAGYKLKEFHLTKVHAWFGMSLLVVWELGGNNCINYDRTIHK